MYCRKAAKKLITSCWIIMLGLAQHLTCRKVTVRRTTYMAASHGNEMVSEVPIKFGNELQREFTTKGTQVKVNTDHTETDNTSSFASTSWSSPSGISIPASYAAVSRQGYVNLSQMQNIWERILNYPADGYRRPNASVELSAFIVELQDEVETSNHTGVFNLQENIGNMLRIASGSVIPHAVLQEMEKKNATCSQLLQLPALTLARLSNAGTMEHWYRLTGNDQEQFYFNVGNLTMYHSDNYTMIAFVKRFYQGINFNTTLDAVLSSSPKETTVDIVENFGDNCSNHNNRGNCEIWARLPGSLFSSLIPLWNAASDYSNNYSAFSKNHDNSPVGLWMEIIQQNSLDLAVVSNGNSYFGYHKVVMVSRVFSLANSSSSSINAHINEPAYRFPDPVTMTVYTLPLNGREISRYTCGHSSTTNNRRPLVWDFEKDCLMTTKDVFSSTYLNQSLWRITCACHYYGRYAVFRLDDADLISVADILTIALERLRDMYQQGQSPYRLLEEINKMLNHLDTTVNYSNNSALQLVLELFQFGNVISPSLISKVQNRTGICNRLMSLRDNIARNVTFLTNDNSEMITASTKDFSVVVTRFSRISRFVGMGSYLDKSNLSKITAADDVESGSMVTSITMPDSLIDHLIQISERTEFRVWFEVSRNSSIYNATTGSLDSSFTVTSNQTEFTLASWVIGATISGLDKPITDWTDSISIRIKIFDYRPTLNYVCAFWDVHANSKFGAWSTKGCTTGKTDKAYITCYCNHLTSFAILVDPSGLGKLSKDTRNILSVFTSIALITSIVRLVVMTCKEKNFSTTSIRYAVKTRSTRKDLSNKDFVLINLCVSLILAYVTFLCGIDRLESRDLCLTAGVFLHWFFLVSFAWMTAEGLLLFKTFAAGNLIVSLERFQLWSALCCWSMPFVIVTINLTIDRNIYGYGSTKSCWLDSIYAPVQFYLTIILPICLSLAWNILVFILVIKRLISKKLKIRSTRTEADLFLQLRRCLILFVLLGLPWMLLLIDVSNNSSEASLAMHILILIFCGTQGIGILFIQVCEIKPVFGKISKVIWSGRTSSTKAANSTTTVEHPEHKKSHRTAKGKAT
ncbi:uncharacterized protein LOC129593613 [Paramacrobiotus metropolitanus]|uniref:uncharacterized protein LOC129593613 n=1 Tax=Paramacrobiotus metropolitanus TaxID=2943436 RepID=UPI0024463114|nr:uncharacterized protein LOC129593613 [Paramacrobiotus metropolitanus]